MRVLGINIFNKNIKNKTQSLRKQTTPSSLPQQNTFVIKKRIKELSKQGVVSPYADIIAELDKSRYQRALSLAKDGVESSCIEEVSGLEEDKYTQANILIKKGILDSFIYQIANMDEETFNKALTYYDMGFDADCLKLFAELDEEQTEIAKELLKNKKLAPFAAGHLAKLDENQRKTAISLLPICEANVAAKIATLPPELQEKCKKYIDSGINPLFVTELAKLKEDEEKRLDEIFNLNIGEINIADFAKMSAEEYARAKNLYLSGVHPDYILDIISIEEGRIENEEYKTYRDRGYSYTTSITLSLLEDNEIKELGKIIKKHPEIKKLFEQEYKIEVIELQNDEEKEAILTNRYRSENGTIIELVQTFDSFGEITKSRTERYTDGTISSSTDTQTGVFHIKKDQFGEIQESTEFIQDKNTHEVTGIVYTKASDLLKGAFESVYYDISDIKEGGNITPDMDITQAVKTQGEPISTVTKNSDGSITYTEDFQMNDYTIQRNHTEKRDENGNLKQCEYSYKITNEEEDKVVMDLSRSFVKNDDGTATNIINGVKYEIKYNDEDKTITISDGQKTKILDFSKKLPAFSDFVIWDAIKNLPVDTLLTIDTNIDKWHYCVSEDSVLQEANRILSTSDVPSIIEHETGHIYSLKNEEIFDDDELIQKYGREMEAFKISMPFEQQDFIQYFSPRADLMQATGYGEFLAESNILLNTLCSGHKKFCTRTQFLAKYFPESIARVAELTKKTSKESLL